MIRNIISEDQPEVFLNILFSGTKHDIEIRAIDKNGIVAQHFKRDFKKITQIIKKNSTNAHIYFGVYTREGHQGKAENVREATCIYADMDFKDYKGGQEEADATIKRVPVKPSIIIHSGNGYHLYWILSEAIDVQALKSRVLSILGGMANALMSDTSVVDIARVLRIPGTLNHKTTPPKPVNIVNINDARYSLEDFKEYETLTCKPAEDKTCTSTEVNGIIERCNFLKYCHEHREDLPEPFWYAMVTNICRLPEGVNLCHSLSVGYPGYTQNETNRKILHALNDAGPHTCEYIRQTLGFVCEKECNVTAPIVQLNKSQKKNTVSQADKLIAIASKLKLFHDDNKEAYAAIENKAIKIRSSSFKQWLAKELWQNEGKAPNSDALNQALNVIEAQGNFNGECIKLYNRVAEYDGNFYFDLSNGRAVKITKYGWSIVDTFPILFKQYSHQQKQVDPKKGGDIQKLFRFLNVTQSRHKLLILVYLISCFIPNIPHPIFHPWGDQGSGKTTMFKFFKFLLDPSKLDVIITPKDHNELIQVLEHHYLCLFDNLSSCPDWLSDLLSQACTGGGFSKRRLYTDDDDIIYQVMRCIGLNGINLLIAKPDLMDRTILLNLERIEPEHRKEEKVLMQDFQKERPYLLGCCFDVLSKAMYTYPSVKLSHLPRMADFMTHGVAITKALEYKADDFIKAYQANIESQNAEIITSSTLAQAVLTFMKNKDDWDGTVQEAYEELCKLVTVKKEDNTFPKYSNKLRKSLNKIKSNLLDYGIKFTIADFHEDKGVPVSFQKIEKVSSGCSVSSESNDIKDLQAEDTLKIPEDTQKLSSGHNILQNNDFVVPEDTEDKIPILEGEV